MLIEILNKLAGGTWVLKDRCQTSRNPLMRRALRLIYTKALQKKGSWISLDAQFKTIPYFPHGIYGIFISGGASIGRNATIFQQVTIGSNTLIDSSGLGAPVIGDNCYIGVGAKIIGKVILGNNVRVGANTVVVQDVPDNSIVTTSEQRIIKRDNLLNNHFYQRVNGRWRFVKEEIWVQVEDSNEIRLLETAFPSKEYELMNRKTG
jgi:serine O-acetyltransferase